MSKGVSANVFLDLLRGEDIGAEVFERAATYVVVNDVFGVSETGRDSKASFVLSP